MASYTAASRGTHLKGGHVSGTRSICGHCLPAVPWALSVSRALCVCVWGGGDGGLDGLGLHQQGGFLFPSTLGSTVYQNIKLAPFSEQVV